MTDDTFGLMLRRPGDVANPDAEFGADDEHEGIYLAPDFTERHDWWKARAGTDPRDSNRDNQWSLSLPHQCDEWSIWDGDRADVLAAAYRFRAELDGAIAAMEAADD